MEERGLCMTCVYDNDCAFIRIYPVLECDEFFSGIYKRGQKKKKSTARCKRRKR